MEMQKNKPMEMWLFKDGVIERFDYKFVGYSIKPSKNPKVTLPVVELYGNIKGLKGQILSGLLYVSTWNIINFNELLEQYGTDTVKWVDLFFKIELTTDEKRPLKFIPTEVVKI